MKFALNIEYGNYNTNDRVVAFESKYDYFRKGTEVDCKFHVNALVKTTEDFSLTTREIQFVGDSCSVQYRPKGLHKNTKGVFYKLGSSRVYLTPEQETELNAFIDECLKKKSILVKLKKFDQ